MDAKTLLHRWEQSRAAFRKLAEAIPAGKEGFRSAPGTMSLADLVLHVASADKTAIDALTVTPGKWEWKTGLDSEHYPAIKDVLAALDRQTEATRKYLAGLRDEDLKSKIRAPWGEMTTEEFFYEWIIHEVHHRGNLVTGLRVAGVTPPNIW